MSFMPQSENAMNHIMFNKIVRPKAMKSHFESITKGLFHGKPWIEFIFENYRARKWYL
jgi:hypothetical protein